MTRRSRAVASIALLAIAASLVAGWLLLRSGSREGPLAANANQIDVEWDLAPGQTGTWGTLLPANPTSSDISITSVEPTTIQGVEVVGVVLCDATATGGCVGTAMGFPPASLPTSPVDGGVLPPSTGDHPSLMALVGVRRQTDQPGSIRGLTLKYRAGGQDYQIALPDSLFLGAGDTPSP